MTLLPDHWFFFLPSTYTPVEFLWTMLGVIGFTIGSRNCVDVWRDYETIRRDPAIPNYAPLCLIARGAVRQELLRTSKMVVIFFVGLLAGLTTPPLPPGVHLPNWTPTTVVVTCALFYLVACIIIQMELDRRLRHRFYKRPGRKDKAILP